MPWSDELLYEVTVQASDEEGEDEIDTTEPLGTLLQPPKCRCTTRPAR